MKKNNKEACRDEDGSGGIVFKTNQRFEVGNRVRRELNKGKLDKASALSWSAERFKVTGVIGKRGSVAEKYRINAKGFGDKTFTRNDLQKVIGEVEKAPELKRAPTRSEKGQRGGGREAGDSVCGTVILCAACCVLSGKEPRKYTPQGVRA